MTRFAVAIGLAVVAAAPASPVTSLAGRYSIHERDPFTGRGLDSVLEIVPVDAGHAYFRVALDQPNGSCDVSGVARVTGRGLFYRALAPAAGDDTRCTLTITPDGSDVIVDDSDAMTCRAHCGISVTVTGGFSLRSRRSIAYLGRLRHSPQYRAAVVEWRRQRPGY